MKTKEEILNYKGGENCNFVDGRDKRRLTQFFDVSDWEKLGFKPAEGFDASKHVVEDLTEQNVLKHLAKDLNFAFEKALNRRDISSSLMFDVIKMWMWVLDDEELMDFNSYAMYGLPLYKAVAIKYNLPNQIGDDSGDESKYEEDCE